MDDDLPTLTTPAHPEGDRNTTPASSHPTKRPHGSDIPTLTCHGTFWSETPVPSRLNLWTISDGVESISLPMWPADADVINAQAPARASRPFIEDVIDISRQLLARPAPPADQNIEPNDLPEEEHADGTCPSCEQPLRLDGTCQNRSFCIDFEYCDNLECRVCWDQCNYCWYTKSGTDDVCAVEDCPSHEPHLITAAETVTGPPWFKQAFDVKGPPWFTKPFRDRQQWHIT